jgi:tight adherence protein C
MTLKVLLAIGTGLLLLVMFGVLLHERRLAQERQLAARVRAIRSLALHEPQYARQPVSLTVSRVLTQIGNALVRSGLLPWQTLDELEHTLSVAGLGGANVGLFLGAKLAALLLLPLGGEVVLHLMHPALSPMARVLIPCALAVIGLLLPDYVVRRLNRRHLHAVNLGLADALDMLVICAEAGLGLDTAIERVATELQSAHPAVAEELKRTSDDLRVLADRRAALLKMGERTGLDSLKRLGGTLVQSMQYGTPLTRALRTLAAEMRQETLTRFEARAARLPVLLTVPMIIFILPCLFLIVAGPAALAVLPHIRG